MAEGARLESVYTFIAYRGFESLSLRQIYTNVGTSFEVPIFVYEIIPTKLNFTPENIVFSL